MNIKWYRNNYVTNDQNVPALSQLINDFSKNYPDSSEKMINLIIDEKLLQFELISKLLEQVNIFGNFNMTLGTYSEPLVFDSNSLKDKTIWIGGTQMAKQLKEGIETATIAHSSEPNDICIGFQRHHSTNLNPRSVSLGELKTSPNLAEVIFRSVPTIIFNINSVRKQDSYYNKSKITGLDIYEAARLARYIGMSKENLINFFHVDTEEMSAETAELVAALIWYQLEGIRHQDIENNRSQQSYLVNSEYFSAPIEFLKGQETGRWWYIHPDNKTKQPCTEQDYQSVRDGKIPDSFLAINLKE